MQAYDGGKDAWCEFRVRTMQLADSPINCGNLRLGLRGSELSSLLI
jgi:hypothetical protein